MLFADRRVAIAVGAAVAIVLALVAFLLGRSSADGSGEGEAPAITMSAGGVAIGTQQTRAGALAAADNYVATSTDLILARPREYEAFVRRAYVPSKATAAITEAKTLRDDNPNTVAALTGGMRTMTWSAARRLVAFTGTRAEVRTWTGSSTWAGPEKPTQSWAMNRTVLAWVNGEWRIDSMDGEPAAAPAPALVRVQGQGDTNAVWEKQLDGMTAPLYGAG